MRESPSLDDKGTDMRSIWMQLSLALALLGVVPLAAAAGFDCAKASNTVERVICGNSTLSALDSQVADAYTHARQRAGGDEVEKLQRDQRNWLAERNGDLSWYFCRDRNDLIGNIQSLYFMRVKFLNSLFNSDGQNSPILDAIRKKLSVSASQNEKSAWNSIGGDGSVFKMAVEQDYNIGEVEKHVPFGDQKGFNAVVVAFDSSAKNGRVTLALLPAAKFGGIYDTRGDLHSVAWSLFTWQGDRIWPVQTPQALQNFGNTSTALVLFRGQIYAMSDVEGFVTSNIRVQAWHGFIGGWSSVSRLLVRYDYILTKPIGYCDSGDKQCDELTARGYDYARRYSRSRVVEALNSSLSNEERKKFDAMRTVAGDGKALETLPTFGAASESYPNFAFDSVWFPVRWHGELMLGRIGHGGPVWHPDDNWYVGIWRWDGKSLSPVIGVVVPVQRSDYLLSEII